MSWTCSDCSIAISARNASDLTWPDNQYIARPSTSQHVQTLFTHQNITTTHAFHCILLNIQDLAIYSTFLIQVVTMVVERVSLNLPRVSLSADTSSSVSNHSNSSGSSPSKANHRLSFQTPPTRTREQDRYYSFVNEGEWTRSALGLVMSVLRDYNGATAEVCCPHCLSIVKHFKR